MDLPARTDPPASSRKTASGTRWLVGALRWALLIGCVVLFGRALARSDLASAWSHIRSIGPLALLVVVPFPAALAFDAWAWKILLRTIDRSVSLLTLFKVRLATEAVTNSTPVGALWADALAPILVSRRADVPPEDVFATTTAKRWLVVRAHATYVTIATVLGFHVLQQASRPLLGTSLLLPIVLGSVVFLGVFSWSIEALAARGQIAARVSRRLGKTRFVRVSAWIEKRHHHFAKADVQLERLSKSNVGFGATMRLLGMWVTEGFETYLIFRLLGMQLGVVEVLSMDAAMSVVRSVALFAPSGIGVQDVGYLAMLEAYGVADASTLGPAFIVVKRAKEALWLGVGFVILARSRPREVLAEAKREVEEES